ncbi:hypothetical protein C2S53_009540 [Perilla frutescens var. hirtella]|uniref:Uncharacterized protein n=1 Tax=Perilla frutescens var. hirtella TaxID=608512 RepID=A0AAD4JBP9_PERFH|nr:hypothetical protein C2S53_009540 [Perilla frutescens var. hirtella]
MRTVVSDEGELRHWVFVETPKVFNYIVDGEELRTAELKSEYQHNLQQGSKMKSMAAEVPDEGGRSSK